jgi:4-hydroxy-2-oxoheptanedioate aldolase
MQAMRYWGINSIPEYIEAADLWPLNPDGELLLMLLVEDSYAWDHIEELVAVPGVGAVLWGPGDGSLTLGLHTFDMNDPALAPYRQKVVGACKAAGVAVGHPLAVDPYGTIDEGFDFFAIPDWDAAEVAKIRAYAESKRNGVEK